MDVHRPSQVPGHQRTNQFTQVVMDTVQSLDGVPCTVFDVAPVAICPQLQAKVMPNPHSPTCFYEVLCEWDCTWMWDNLQCVGDDDWME